MRIVHVEILKVFMIERLYVDSMSLRHLTLPSSFLVSGQSWLDQLHPSELYQKEEQDHQHLPQLHLQVVHHSHHL